MRHQVAGRKLGRTTSHRWALFRNQVASLVDKERIETTLYKAKELRSIADHLITLGKQDSLNARRQAFYFLRDKGLVGKLFSELAPRFASRQGGYTRLLKTGFRLGDSAPLALIEYIDRPQAEPKAAPKKGKVKKEAAPKAAAEEKKAEKDAKKAEKAAKKEAAPKKEKKEKAPAAKKAAPKKSASAEKKEAKPKKAAKK